MIKEETIDVDRIIDKLLDVRGCKPGKKVNLTETEIKGICIKARDVFISQPILLELEAPIKICGIQRIDPRRHPWPVLRPSPSL